MARFAVNPHRCDHPDWSAPELDFVRAIAAREQLEFHRALAGYGPTPLVDAEGLACELGIGRLLVKDESGRFGIQAFKALGASYAVDSLLRRLWREKTGASGDPELRRRPGPITIAAATDGNHGRAVAWTARRLGLEAVVFMPEDAAPARVDHVIAEGAEVKRVPGSFDDCVLACAEAAAREGWHVVADTAYPGNLEIPGRIMTGYSTIFVELAEQVDFAMVDVVVLPAGVGGLAAAGAAFLTAALGARRSRLVTVEPESAACFLESVTRGQGEPVRAGGDLDSAMVGLCCGMPSLLAWPVVRDAVDLMTAIEDEHALWAMRAYRRHGITSGESGAATLAGLRALLACDELAPGRDHLDLGPRSRVLVINTEGDTDPENYRRVIAGDRSEGSP